MINKFINFIKSRAFIVVIAIIFALALLSGVFSIGAAVGYHRARLSYSWGENYQRNFAGPRGGFVADFNGKNLIENYATFGRIIKIGASDFIIQGRNDTERLIIVNADTSIDRFHQPIKLSDLQINDNVIIIGEPNNSGQIDAKFIRLIPAVPVPSVTQNQYK